MGPGPVENNIHKRAHPKDPSQSLPSPTIPCFPPPYTCLLSARMPIYRQQPPLVVDTALEIIKDDSVAPSPATILPPQLPPSTPTPNVRPEDVARIMNDTLQRVIAAQSQRDLSRFNSSAAQNGSAIVDDNDVEDLDFDRRYTMAAERFMRRPPATSWTKTAQPVPIRTGHSDQTDAFSSGTFDIPQRSQYTSTKLRAFSDVSQLLSRPTFSPLAASFPDVVDERTEEEEDLDLLPLHDQRGRSPSSDYTYRRDHSRTPSSGVASDSFRVCDPCADVTRIRTTTRGNKYIYPGATFTGTQKSGRNNYDVTVTVVVSLADPHVASESLPLTTCTLFPILRTLTSPVPSSAAISKSMG